MLVFYHFKKSLARSSLTFALASNLQVTLRTYLGRHQNIDYRWPLI